VSTYPKPKPGNYVIIVSDGQAETWVELDQETLLGGEMVPFMLGGLDALYKMHPEKARPS
jgi:hypothetical protein